MGRYLLLWLLGIPIPILILIWAFGGLHCTSCRAGHGPSGRTRVASALRADGGALGRRDPDRKRLVVRAQMGRLSLPCLPQSTKGRSPVQGRASVDALFSRSDRGGAQFESREVCPRRRDRCPAERDVLVRRSAPAHPSGAKPRAEAGGRNARTADRV